MLRSLFVADGDGAVRTAMTALFSKENYHVSTFEDSTQFLNAVAYKTPSCILLDVDMPGIGGLDILRDIKMQLYSAPVLMTASEAGIALAVQAIKLGAFDFLEKPLLADAVLKRVEAAVAASLHRIESQRYDHARFVSGGEKLTARERDVLRQITGGASNKEAGRQLGISPRTIEVHRARIMQKMAAKNVADLVRIVVSQKEMSFG